MALMTNPYQPMQTMGQPTWNPYAAPQMNFQPYQPQTPQVMNNNTVFAWVQGENGGKAYPLGPNCRAFLFDSEKDSFYVKTTDQSGMPQPLRSFDYFERTESASDNQQIDTSNFVTKEELEEALSKLNRRKEEYRQNGKSSIRNNEQHPDRSIQ